MWICYLAAIPLAFISDFMTLIREESRYIAQFPPPATPPWNEIRPCLNTPATFSLCQTVATLCENAVLRGPTFSAPPAFVGHSDASCSAMAGVTLDNRVSFSIFQQIAQPDIFIVELLAGALLSIVLRHIHGDSSPPLPWLWITDSLVAKFAMLKGHSAPPLADEVSFVFLVSVGNSTVTRYASPVRVHAR